VKIDSHIAAYKKNMLANNWAEMPNYFVTSATESVGKEELLGYIEEVNQGFSKQESILKLFSFFM
jgi:GTP-binding protein